MDKDMEDSRPRSGGKAGNMLNIVVVILVVVSLVVNLVSLATIAYLTSYTVDKVGGFEDDLKNTFLMGNPETSWADVVNKQLRTNYYDLFLEAASTLDRVSTALESSPTEYLQEVGAFMKTMGSFTEMLKLIRPVTDGSAKPVGDGDMDGGVLGDIVGLSGGKDSKMVKFLESQGDKESLNALGTTCKLWLTPIASATWGYSQYHVKGWDVSGRDGYSRCVRYGDNYQCQKSLDVTQDVRALVEDVRDVCNRLETVN
uniref:Uncharacterized protein n=1 Tax=Pyramimonas obovata TaxID=1411642 RepID=A0A7S0QN45_9CHLO|mmetsp:Transcript_11914/g.25068  ORF Transcript_11914/g.25068 Transcript_11914/m.25068 type:complete len:257 (+) Transcript_11914:160-930(+)|eukprot:CAMPEP_0118930318 /NCGR_PEP_ID=MMETSP1169-20130426/7047_1 /TAXON_ID=36882 /ORGANISM="Pyramimonas obovata, Strain CCMP722" /LENGTH=256 /DNA_ID=CAMNT_0006872651 /DNA_START=154 /DNA_END=924 /DNA_ORIENTATION=-